MDKKTSRLRRAKKARFRIRLAGLSRLTVHKTPKHIYAQIFSPDLKEVEVSCSTLESEVRGQLKSTCNKEAAGIVGKLLAERAKAKGLERVAFDRSGFKYHGRLAELADTARKNGLLF